MKRVKFSGTQTVGILKGAKAGIAVNNCDQMSSSDIKTLM